MGRPAYPKISKNTYLYINGKKASNAPERKLIYNIAVRNNSYFKISIGRLTFFAIQTSIQSKPSVSLYLSKLTQHTHALSLSLRSSRSSSISLSLSLWNLLFLLWVQSHGRYSLSLSLSLFSLSLSFSWSNGSIYKKSFLFFFDFSDRTVEILSENCECFDSNRDLKPSSPSASGSHFH